LVAILTTSVTAEVGTESTEEATDQGSTVTSYLGFENYWGWSNQIQELKTMATFAKATSRTLILPRYALGRKYTDSTTSKQMSVDDCYYGYEQFSEYCEKFEDLIDVDRLREFVPVKLEEDYLSMFPDKKRLRDLDVSVLRINYGVDFKNRTLRMQHKIRWVDEHVDYQYTSDKKKDRSKWCHTGALKLNVCERSIFEIAQSKDMLTFFPEFHTFAVARIRSRVRAKQYALDHDVDRFIAPSKVVKDSAMAIFNKLGSDYIGVHLRRGDFLTETWSRDMVKNIDELVLTLFKDPNVGEKTPVYIATDEVDDEALVKFQILNSSVLKNYETMGNNESFSLPKGQLVRSYIDQMICIGALEFQPNRGSTFSRYILDVRDKLWNMEAHGFEQSIFFRQKKVLKARQAAERERKEQEMLATSQKRQAEEFQEL
jgi:hypothetical protein